MTPPSHGLTSAHPGLAKRRPAEGESDDPATVARREALGRSRGGGLTTEALAIDGRGLPLSIVLSMDSIADCTMLPAVLDAIRVPRVKAGGRRPGPTGSRSARPAPLGRSAGCRGVGGIKVTIPERRGGRLSAFDKAAFKRRNVGGRCFVKQKQFRAVATRFDKLANRYRAGSSSPH